MLSKIATVYKSSFHAVTGLGSRVVGALLGNRSVALGALLACALLAVAPWLRPAVSRDFRGIHIPWSGALSSNFLPEQVAEVPRPWRWDSVAMPILVVVAVGVVIVLLRPAWTKYVFGVLVVLSIPAVAAAFWNHPALVEFLEGEVRQRAMIRAVIRQHADDMLSGGAPDRLSVLGGHKSTVIELETVHPLWFPFRYSVYGTWLIGAALIGLLVAQSGSWSREYHWANSESRENANQITAAAESLEQARAAMPQFEHTRRYWVARGRIEYRQHRDNDFVAYFKASQHVLQDKPDLARAELEPQLRRTGGTAPERDLLAEVIGRLATRYITAGDQSAAEVAWSTAAALVPWEPAYWIADTSTVLAAAPGRAHEMQDKLVPRLAQVGDRMVNSDFSSLIADAYFVTGDMERAREFYSRAMETFDLPKYVNLHAQKGMLGM